MLEGLKAVKALAPARSGVKEGIPVEPADPATVVRTVPLMPPAVRAIVGLLRLTGARPGEVMRLRPGEVDRSGGAWVFRLARYKESWRGKPREVHLGPAAQAVLAPWLDGVGAGTLAFTPSRSEDVRAGERAAARVDAGRSVRRPGAVELRIRYGLEVVRAVLGHAFKGMSNHSARAADVAG